MLQLIYVSSKSLSVAAVDLDALLKQARRNNDRDGITGLLYTDGARFLQAVEGPEREVIALQQRLQADVRHRAIVTLSQRSIAAREFGNWSMANVQLGESDRDLLERVETLCRHANPSVSGTFTGLIRARMAAKQDHGPLNGLAT